MGTYVLDALCEAVVADESVSLVALCTIEPVDALVYEAAEDVDADEVGDGGGGGGGGGA